MNSLKFFVIVLMINAAVAGELERNKGLSVHMLPKRVAEIANQASGFVVKPVNEPKINKTFKTGDELVDYFKKLPSEVQENGIWLVTTDPESYEAAEMENLKKLEKICSEKKIPLLECRASKLPNGWKRID
ncbi:MAG: SIR2-like protein domain protein [Pedosphaera sp.]|nr:SIR2-like protein domain protein [Pedosphaera sp.]